MECRARRERGIRWEPEVETDRWEPVSVTARWEPESVTARWEPESVTARWEPESLTARCEPESDTARWDPESASAVVLRVLGTVAGAPESVAGSAARCHDRPPAALTSLITGIGPVSSMPAPRGAGIAATAAS